MGPDSTARIPPELPEAVGHWIHGTILGRRAGIWSKPRVYPLWVRTRIAGGAIRRGVESVPVWMFGLAILGCWIAEVRLLAAEAAEVVLPRISQWELGDDERWKVPASISPFGYNRWAGAPG